MKARFLLVPLAAFSMAQDAGATVYMTADQARSLMFPDATFEQVTIQLTSQQIAAIEHASDTNVINKQVQAWKMSNGGWFIVDEVVGKHEFIPFALGLDATGAVKDVEILEYREAYGSQIRNDAWRAQFTGKTAAVPLRLAKEVQNISGATLSSKHITDGVRRLLTTYAMVLAGH